MFSCMMMRYTVVQTTRMTCCLAHIPLATMVLFCAASTLTLVQMQEDAFDLLTIRHTPAHRFVVRVTWTCDLPIMIATAASYAIVSFVSYWELHSYCFLKVHVTFPKSLPLIFKFLNSVSFHEAFLECFIPSCPYISDLPFYGKSIWKDQSKLRL